MIGSASGADRTSVDVSSNWAGYALTSRAGVTTSFTTVTASWREPTVRCTAADAGAKSSVWVGLGGYSPGSQALEQIGAEADCNHLGKPSYFAWYDFPPAAGVILKAGAVRAGDTITASVEVGKITTQVTIRLTDRTAGWTYSKHMRVALADLSSAEWIAEVPALCDGCHTPPLADFGSVSLQKIAAVGNGHRGTITDSAWKATQIRLVPSARHAYFTGSSAGAVPNALASDGTSFSVGWRAHTTPVAPKPVSPLIAGVRSGRLIQPVSANSPAPLRVSQPALVS